MIIGIGIDSVEIERFAHWHTYADAQLLKVFSQEEIDYCRANALKSSERFAVRFAAREALFKALNSADKIPFLHLCKAIHIQKKSSGAPMLCINWKMINCEHLEKCTAWISFTHTKNVATAMVILEQKNRC